MTGSPSDPTKDPEFQKVVRHFVTTAPKTHDEMQADKHKVDSDMKASPKKRGRPAKEKRA
jgi:hypothetical protein